MTTASTKMSRTGRITVPIDVRAAAGLERGGPVVLEVVDGELRIRGVAQTMRRARALTREIIAGRSGLSVDDFLKDRRREAERET
jgi:bifunctional DNA-binding transcriptional regulator/antitoxin component of YhaV-PrlF toxin-antitoxin module